MFELTANFLPTFGTFLCLCCKIATFENTRKQIHHLLRHGREFETLEIDRLEIKFCSDFSTGGVRKKVESSTSAIQVKKTSQIVGVQYCRKKMKLDAES